MITLFFVGVERGREGRARFAGGIEGSVGDGDGDDVPLTTAAMVSEIAKERCSMHTWTTLVLSRVKSDTFRQEKRPLRASWHVTR